MKKNEHSNQDSPAKTEGTEVKLVGSSILYKTDINSKSTRFTTLYGPNSAGKNKADGSDFNDGFFAYSHPDFENRPKRLDLISNHLNKVRLKVNNKPSALCDLSDYGFSYAKRLTKFSGDYYHLKNVVASSAKKLVGQKINASFQAQEDESVKSVDVSGTVQNVKLVYGLLLSEAELEFKKFLYRKTIHRNNDKFNAYDKLEYLVDLVNKEIEDGNWGDALAVKVNTTILNMMLEIGATEDTVDKMYEGYNARPRFIRFGAVVEDNAQIKELQEFTHSITTLYREKIEAERKALSDAADANKIKKSTNNIPQVPVDIDFSFQKFLLKAWYGCVARFGLDHTSESLKSSNHNLAKHLKLEARAFNDILNRLPEKKPNQMNLKATELLITECIMRGLDNLGDHEFENIEVDVQVIVSRTFELCIREFVAKLQA